MESNKTRLFAAGAGVLAIMLMFSVTQTLKTAQNSKSFDDFLNISMPRPIKDFMLGFSLEGRNVIREVEGNLLGQTVVKKLKKKSADSGTKALVDKGQKAKAASVAAARSRSQLNEQRRKAFQARVIEQAERYRQSLRAQAPSEVDSREDSDYNSFKTPKNSTTATPENKEKEKNGDALTAAEWKSLVLTQPTEDNVQKMIKALPANEIEMETYLEITEALLKDNSQEKRRMGVWALTSVYKQEAFTFAAHIAPDTDAATQKLLNDYMYNYNRTQTLGILEQVLKSQDSVGAAAAAQSITKAIENLKATPTPQQVSNDRSGSRAGGISQQVQQLTLSSYKRLIPTLKIVADRNINNLSQWAQNLLSQLQTAVTTA